MDGPRCKYFGRCGGCSAQHIPYSTQLENKRNVIAHATGFDDIKIFHGDEYHYRNRMDMIFHPKGFGFREKGNWKNIVDIEKCVISNAKLNQLLEELRDFFKEPDYFDLIKKTGTFKYAVIRTPGKKSSISFVLNDKSTRIAEAIEQVKEFSNKTTADNILITYVKPEEDISISTEYFVIKGEDKLSETFLSKGFWFNSQGFFQNNSVVAEMMQSYVFGLLQKYETKDANLLDIYGGVGTFGITCSDLFKKTMIVESFAGSIASAKENIKLNNSNAEAFCLDAKQIRRLDLKEPLFVICDPPRSGMDQSAIDVLKSLEPEVIIYISCNPKQLKKEVEKFKRYEIKSAAMFDMFPQTPHVESIIELVKKI